MKKVDAGKLSDEVTAILADYGTSVTEGVQKAIQEVAKECRDDIKAHAPVSDEETRHYRDSWSVQIKKSRNGCTATIHNKSKPGLAHLLENGHALRNGGRANAFPHIGPAEERAVDKAERKLKEVVSNG